MSAWNPSTNHNKRRRVIKIDPHHCRCFSIQKPYLSQFELRMKALGYHEPILEEDHGQYCSFAQRISEYSQIHIKLTTLGKIEAEIEPPQDYPMAHLNSIHSYSAHKELSALLSSMQIPFKCKRSIPYTCIQPLRIAPQQPTHRNMFLVAAGIVALLDLHYNDGKITRKSINFLMDETSKIHKRKTRRRKYLTPG